MPRYFTRPIRAQSDVHWEETPPFVTNLTVCDHRAVNTGLLDLNGNSIMRAPNPMGFGKDDEW